MLLHLSCIPYDLQISKLDAYDFDKEAPSLIYSYLKNRKQTVLQASVFRALPFNIFLNDLYLFITKVSFLTYANDNTLSAYSSEFTGKHLCRRILFNKVAFFIFDEALGLQLYQKRVYSTGVFLWTLRNF